MGLIIDTSAIIAIERSGGGFGDVLADHGRDPVAMPAIVWAELLVGVRLAKGARRAAQRRAWLEQVRLRVPLIEFDDRVAEHYADIFAECTKAGKMIPQNDMAVAATARCYGYRVLIGPKGEEHFRRVKGLKLVGLR